MTDNIQVKLEETHPPADATRQQSASLDGLQAGISERGTGKKKIPGHIVVSETTDPNAKWYVVHTSSGHEVRVMETLRQRVETMNLQGKIFEMLVPTQDRVIIRGGKKATIKEKIFPGYLLIKMILDDPTWLAVR